MPVPGGEITGSEIWHTPLPDSEIVAKIEVDENGNKTITEYKAEEPCDCDDGCDGCKE